VLGCEPLPPGAKGGDGKEQLELACPAGGALFGLPCVPGLAVPPPLCAPGLCPDLATGTCIDCFAPCAPGGSCPVRPLVDGCPPGFAQCSLDLCRDLLSDPLHCGACGLACRPGELCRAGTCTAQLGCPAGLTECPPFGFCRNLFEDRINCGACGVFCGPDAICVRGACQFALAVCPPDRCPLACPDGLVDCGDGCTDLARDPRHCGACGEACAFGEACFEGGCVFGCSPELTRCEEGCADLLVDEANCGRCGRACPPGAVCISGTCL
jgi:hypothetical protein